MSGITDLKPLLNKLDSQIDGLEDALEPLLGDVEAMSSQMPLLDKAKLFSLIAYSIETLLFSTLKLEGQEAQEHAVFTELKRVQQYFAKIKAAEEPEAQRNTTVNQEAAARILKADLSDNKAISSRLAEKIAEERAKALLKSVENRKRPAEDSAQTSSQQSGGQGKGHRKKKSKKNKGNQ